MMKFMKAKASIFGLNFHIMRRLLNGCLLRPQMNTPYPRALQMAKLMMARNIPSPMPRPLYCGRLSN